MKLPFVRLAALVVSGSFLLASGHAEETAFGGPKVIFDPGADGAAAIVKPNGNSGPDISYQLSKDGIDIKVIPNSASSFPGVMITPATPFNASGYGHIETKVTNNGEKPIRINLRLDNEGPWQENRWSANVVTVKPGASVVVPTIMGYQYGKAGYQLKKDAISQVIIFAGKSDVEQNFRVESLIANGPADEKPYVDPNTVAAKPPGGVILGDTVIEAKQLVAQGGAKAAVGAEGKSFSVQFSGQPNESVQFKPVAGFWNLNQHLQVRVKLKNTGAKPLSLKARLDSQKGSSPDIPMTAPIAPGADGEFILPFMAAVPWVCVTDPAQEDPTVKKEWSDSMPGTGTRYASNTTKGITLLPGEGSASFTVTSMISDMPSAPVLPEWLGKRPPVEGDWTQTFNEEFEGDKINHNLWSIYTEGEWHLGANTHYSKDNVILKDGKLILRIEKKRGHHNDDPKMPANDYATGYAETYGRWTQRYGYFETRVKAPTAPNTFYAVWLMPDRGPSAGPQYKRAETKMGGMEYDIWEGLSIFGPNRHDFGMHWDGYQKFHKSIGMFTAYVHPDKDGFITVGMLWLPGQVILYDNGKEAARWESPRVGNLQSYWIIDNITGGWETEPMDDSKLPADLEVDYVRAWQRKDLATPEDGPKPNQGGLYPDGAGPKP